MTSSWWEKAQNQQQNMQEATLKQTGDAVKNLQQSMAEIAALNEQQLKAWQTFNQNFWQACASLATKPSAVTELTDAVTSFCEDSFKNTQEVQQFWQQQSKKVQSQAADILKKSTTQHSVFQSAPKKAQATASATTTKVRAKKPASASVTKLAESGAKSAAKKQSAK